MPAELVAGNVQSPGTHWQLLVEGNDMRNFFEALVEHLNRDHEIEVVNFGGANQMAGFLAGFATAEGFGDVRSIGIVRDAEASATNTFKSVQTALANANLPVPDGPETRLGGKPSVSVLILPGGSESGMLETLLCESIEQDESKECIDAFFRCLTSMGIEVKRPEKARARVYITTKREAHLSVGVAAKRKYWDLEHEAFAHVRRFLMEL